MSQITKINWLNCDNLEKGYISIYIILYEQ